MARRSELFDWDRKPSNRPLGHKSRRATLEKKRQARASATISFGVLRRVFLIDPQRRKLRHHPPSTILATPQRHQTGAKRELGSSIQFFGIFLRDCDQAS